MNKNKPESTEEYIAGFPADVQVILNEVRSTIQQAAPEATEKISYGMPAFVQDGNLVYFAAFTNHIGFYSLPSGNEAFKKELSKYKTGKGSIQFPLDEPMPLKLITRIVKMRVKENKEKAALKKKK